MIRANRCRYSTLVLSFQLIKVGTHEGISPCNKSPEEFTRSDWSQGLIPRTVRTKRFEGWISRRDLSQNFKLVWIRRTSRRDQSWSLRLDFEAKMASSHDGTGPHDLLQGLVAGTSPFVHSDLKASNDLLISKVCDFRGFSIHLSYSTILLCFLCFLSQQFPRPFPLGISSDVFDGLYQLFLWRDLCHCFVLFNTNCSLCS